MKSLTAVTLTILALTATAASADRLHERRDYQLRQIEAGRDSGAFYKRSAASMRRVGRALAAWNKDGSHKASIRRLQARLEPLCRKVDESDGRRATCRGLLATAVAKPTA